MNLKKIYELQESFEKRKKKKKTPHHPQLLHLNLISKNPNWELRILKEHQKNELITVCFFISFWSCWSSYYGGGWPFWLVSTEEALSLPAPLPASPQESFAPKYWLLMQQGDNAERRQMAAKIDRGEMYLGNKQGRQMQHYTRDSLGILRFIWTLSSFKNYQINFTTE